MVVENGGKMSLVKLISILVFVLFFVSSGISQSDSGLANIEPEDKLAVEAILCSGIAERVPIDTVSEFGPEVERVYLWTKISGATDTLLIRHLLIYEGKTVLDLELPVKSASWRTWSYKTIDGDWSGKWEAQVIGADGTVMATIPFMVGVTAKPDSAGLSGD